MIEKLHLNKKNRKKKLKDLRKGFLKYKSDVRILNPDAKFNNYPFYVFRQKSKLNAKPKLPKTLEYFLNKKNSFAPDNVKFNSNIFIVPNKFSMIEEYEKSSLFIKKLFNALYQQTFKEVFIDYSNCSQIDVGASMVMDIILTEFISYYEQLIKGRHTCNVDIIKPINYEKNEVKKILFSIGAYRNLRGFKIEDDKIIDFPMQIGTKENQKLHKQREVHITQTVDYILKCIKSMNRRLTAKAETNLYKVIGEVLQNADEHSDTDKRYSIGYFEKIQNSENEYGTFNLSILNFGNTFYETFNSPNCKNIIVKEQMEEISKKYSSWNFFKKNSFEKENLWTLYALQDGVTRFKDWNRGNGSLRYIESFFKLKGDEKCDNISKMEITTGKTKIIFDGHYKIISKTRGSKNKEYKMITFNDEGDIEQKPDPNYVICTNNYFPGTLISAKIRIDFNNTENI